MANVAPESPSQCRKHRTRDDEDCRDQDDIDAEDLACERRG
jgi:hypothetical protein